MKLGGWQRLWILLSVIWLLPVAFFTVELMPKGFQYERSRSEAIQDLIKKEASKEASAKVKLADGTTIFGVPKGVSRKDLEQLYAKALKRDDRTSSPLRM